MIKKIKKGVRTLGGVGVFAARAYVNAKYPMAKPAWKEASRKTDLPYIEPFLNWFFKV